MAIDSISNVLDPATAARVERLALAVERSEESIVREAVEEYVERAERREEFLRAGVAALEHYRTTGLHVTQDELEEWIEKAETSEDARPPECHI